MIYDFANPDVYVRWPAFKANRYKNFYATISKNAGRLLQGRIVAVDPSSGSSSSNPGYAVFSAGELIDSGCLSISGNKTIDHRLRQQYAQWIARAETAEFLVMEEADKIPGARGALAMGMGVAIVGIQSHSTMMIPIEFWRAVAKAYCGPNYEKTDENDAIFIGLSVLRYAWESMMKKVSK